MRQPFDAARLELVGDNAPLVERVAALGGPGGFSASDTGVLVYYAADPDTNVQLVWVDRRGSVTPVALPPGLYADPSLSPDGRQIALGLRDQSGDHIWVYDVARGTLGKRTFEGSNAFAVWSRDGQYLAFTRGPGFVGPVLRVRSDGSGQPETLVPDPKSTLGTILTAWAGDGRLGFQRGQDVMVAEKDGAIRTVETGPGLQRELRFSPNGRWLSYRSNETGRDEIFVQGSSGGGKWQISTEGGAQPIWSADGRELFYKNVNRMMVVPVEAGDTFTAGTPHVLFEMPLPERAAGDPSRFGVTPDGQRFLLLTTAGGQEASAASPLSVVLNWNDRASPPR
jgi:dipeptidyl aminopeptidase/acylaminoacyl peptidase